MSSPPPRLPRGLFYEALLVVLHVMFASFACRLTSYPWEESVMALKLVSTSTYISCQALQSTNSGFYTIYVLI